MKRFVFALAAVVLGASLVQACPTVAAVSVACPQVQQVAQIQTVQTVQTVAVQPVCIQTIAVQPAIEYAAPACSQSLQFGAIQGYSSQGFGIQGGYGLNQFGSGYGLNQFGSGYGNFGSSFAGVRGIRGVRVGGFGGGFGISPFGLGGLTPFGTVVSPGVVVDPFGFGIGGLGIGGFRGGRGGRGIGIAPRGVGVRGRR